MKYNELSEEAKAVAKDWLLDSFSDTHAEIVTEDFQYTLENKGLPNEDINWSLSYSQGDGTAFYGDIDLEEFIKAHRHHPVICMLQYTNKLKDLPVSFRIERNSYSHMYAHYNTMDISDDYDYDDDPEEESYETVKVLRELILDIVQTTSREMERQGYNNLDFYNGEENVAESMESNDYDFYPCGCREVAVA